MTQEPQFSGPRLMLPSEKAASERLFALVFGGEEDTTAEVTPGSETYIFTHNGELISQVGAFAERLVVDGLEIRVASIGGVSTHPDFRGHKLASQLLEFCAERQRQAGTHIQFISGDRGLYLRQGNVPTGRFKRFLLHPDHFEGVEPLAGLRPAQGRDAEACCRIYHSEPAHFVRDESVFRKAFDDSRLSHQGEKWVVEQDGKPAAYLILEVPWEHTAHPDTGERGIFEWAGDGAALARAAVDLAANHGLSQLEIHVPWQDEITADMLHYTCPGAETSDVPLPDHTLRILHFPGLMETLRPRFAGLVGPKITQGLAFEQSGPLLAGAGDDHCAITLGNERLELDGAAMSRLVFGDSTGADPAASLAPGALQEVLHAVFPLPSFFAGLSFH